MKTKKDTVVGCPMYFQGKLIGSFEGTLEWQSDFGVVISATGSVRYMDVNYTPPVTDWKIDEKVDNSSIWCISLD